MKSTLLLFVLAVGITIFGLLALAGIDDIRDAVAAAQPATVEQLIDAHKEISGAAK